MISTTCPDQTNTFFAILENTPELDLRDPRGKRHSIAVVLLGLTLALLSKRDGSLSSLHRHMLHHYPGLCQAINRPVFRPISRAQLPLVLARVDGRIFSQLINNQFGIRFAEHQKDWFAGDGKELRGSIQSGDRRGEAIVELVQHTTRQVVAEGFYNGQKESEKPLLRLLLAQSGLNGQKITLDALHLNPLTIKPIHQAGGWYIVGLKANQAELYTDWCKASEAHQPTARLTTFDKGHGRIERRSYQSFSFAHGYVDDRWQDCGLQTLLVVERQRSNLQGIAQSVDTHYYVSNVAVTESGIAQELFMAIRHHWSVETLNHCRDVSLGEDKLRTKKTRSVVT